MPDYIITPGMIDSFSSWMLERERAAATVEKYLREIKQLEAFLDGRAVSKTLLLEYRELMRARFKAVTVNAKLSALNAFLDCMGLAQYKLRFLRVQRKAFVEESRELTQEEYRRLLKAAKEAGNERLYHLMITVCGTGIRISELKFITVEAVKRGRAEISLKGKNRTVLLQKQLCSRLLAYASVNSIVQGVIFRTGSGQPLDRSNACHDMKKLCAAAGVQPDKVFPHNLRHLFARSFYAVEKNLAHLADILGHSSIETTRIYVAASASFYERTLHRMKLII